MTRVYKRLADLAALSLRHAPPGMRSTALAKKVLDLARRARYRTGRRFTAAIEHWMEPNRGHPMHDVWLDYALSTNLRGATVVEMLRRHKAVRGARALDVGCAYGGFSIAFAEAGGDAVGIDIDPNLLDFAAKNVADKRARVRLARVDVTDRPRMRELGRFDFITCSDVIEHVSDVPCALENLASALDAGGLLHLQIPNGLSSGLVLKDGHFAAFGITLLGRPDALRYFAEGGFGSAYDVGSYLRLPEYVAMLARHGVELVGGDVQNLPEDPSAAAALVARRVEEIEETAARMCSEVRFSPDTQAALRGAVERYLGEVREQLALLEATDDVGCRRDHTLDLARRYAIDCWDLVALKRG